MAAVKVHLYRYRHPDSTAKDWAVPVTVAPQGLTVYYGRTGSALRQADTPASRCQDGLPMREGALRIREKLGKGYQSLGEFWLADNRRDLTPVPGSALPPAAAAEPEPAPSPCLYWRWRPGATAEAASRRAAVEAACAAARLAAVGWTLPESQPADDGRALWAAVTGDAHHGVLSLADGHQPRVAFWLLLARRLEGLTLADDAQQPVSQWPAELPVAAEILETLGLKPKDVSQLLAACGGDDAWFFG